MVGWHHYPGIWLKFGATEKWWRIGNLKSVTDMMIASLYNSWRSEEIQTHHEAKWPTYSASHFAIVEGRLLFVGVRVSHTLGSWRLVVWCLDYVPINQLLASWKPLSGIQYLLFRIARRNTGWALENNLFGKIAPYRELCGIRSSPVSEAFIFGTCDVVANTLGAFSSLAWIGKWKLLGSWP